jgi:hypothetical protein
VVQHIDFTRRNPADPEAVQELLDGLQ